MSSQIISYKDLLSEDEKDISQITYSPCPIDYHNSSVKKLDVPSLFVVVDVVDNQKFTKAVLFIVKKLVPEFKNTSKDSFTFRHFTDGITNKLVCITDVDTGFSVNVRTFGSFTEYVIDRKSELITLKESKNVILYGVFLNGIVYSYIPGRTLNLGDLIDLKTFHNTALSIAEHHKLKVDLIKVPMLFVTLRKWLKNIPEEYIDSKKIPFDLNILKKELIFLENLLGKNDDIVLCHNDLLLKNFIKEPKGTVKLIDFEYSSYNYRAFDLANHFCEWCGFDCCWDSYPSEETQKRFISIYLTAYYEKDIDTENELVKKLIDEVKYFELCSHYFWGTWGFIEGAISGIDFDYVDYGHRRFKRYFQVKKILFPSEEDKENKGKLNN